MFLSKDNESARKNSYNAIFPFMNHFYREPSRPIEELKREMLVNRLGFNMLKLQESWCIDEKREGEISLDKVEELIEESEKLSLLQLLLRNYEGRTIMYMSLEPS